MLKNELCVGAPIKFIFMHARSNNFADDFFEDAAQPKMLKIIRF